MKTAIVATGAALLALIAARPVAVQSQSTRLTLELQDYAALPITADNTDANTRSQLARVNYLRDEPGGRRFFVNDLNGPLYILDKQTKTFTTYLDFNGLAGHSGLFPKFTYARNFATGLTNVILDPDYARNGVFYTLHMEDPSTPGPSAAPRSGVVPGLDLSGYTTTPAVPTPTVNGQIDREVVLVEWTDRNIANTTFEGTARELLRVQYPLAPHPLGEMTFNPAARPGDPDWRVMYLGAGDSQSGEQRDSRRLNPQRLDTLVGKILRIVPDLREHTSTSTVSENGRYRIPNDNPFVAVDGARKEIWAYGLRNPHRLAWDGSTLLAFNIGLVTWETVHVIHKGANYGYPLREGTQSMSSTNGMGPLPAERHHSDPDLGYRHARHRQAHLSGDRVSAQPRCRWRRDRRRLRLSRHAGAGAERQARVRRHHGRPNLVRRSRGRARGRRRQPVDAGGDSRNGDGPPPTHRGDLSSARREGRRASRDGRAVRPWPRRPAIRRRQRRRALHPHQERRHDSEGRRRARATTLHVGRERCRVGSGQNVATQASATLRNPVASTPESIAAGKRAYDVNCARLSRRPRRKEPSKPASTISIIEEQHGKQPPDLTDDQWDHGSSDSEIFAVIKRGLPPTMMAGFDGRLSDEDVWNIVNYLRSLHAQK